MRMRTEAAKLPPEGRGSRPDGTSGSLPDIGGMSNSLNPKLSSTYSMTISRKDAARQEIEVERASGIIDYVSSGGVFADRNKMTMPIAACVRCGEHASTCMSCTEFLAEEALNFYRKTRARGAASLFANAITQTGVTIVVKYIIYMLWKNGFRTRKWASKKREFKCEILFREHYMRFTFNAWVKYKNTNCFVRRDSRIEELEKRVASLESATTQANNLKANAEAMLSKIQKEKNGYLDTISKQTARIEYFEAALHKERGRVVGLSSLTMPVLSYEEVTTKLSANEKEDIHRNLFIAAASQQPAYDYGKCFNAEDIATLNEAEAKRRNKGSKLPKAENLDEDIELVEMLLNWASTKSRDAGSNMDPVTGKTLDTYLPKYKKAKTFDDFKNGTTMLRLVVGLLWDTPQPGHTTLKLAQPSSVHVVAAATTDAEEETEMGFNHEKVLEDIKSAQKTPFEMITCATDLARKYLALPSFQVGDLVACRPEIYTALLGYLMLASASPAQSANSLSKVSTLISSFEKAVSNTEYAKHQITLKEVKNIQRAWASVHGVDVEIIESDGASEVVVEVDVSVTAAENVVDADGNVIAPAPDAESTAEAGDGLPAAETKEGESDETKTCAVEEEAVVEVEQEEQSEALVKYSKLAAAVDAYITLLGEQNTEDFAFASSNVSPLSEQIRVFGDSMAELKAVKSELNEHQQKTDMGFRLGTDARLLMSRFQLELLTSELKWLE